MCSKGWLNLSSPIVSFYCTQIPFPISSHWIHEKNSLGSIAIVFRLYLTALTSLGKLLTWRYMYPWTVGALITRKKWTLTECLTEYTSVRVCVYVCVWSPPSSLRASRSKVITRVILSRVLSATFSHHRLSFSNLLNFQVFMMSVGCSGTNREHLTLS